MRKILFQIHLWTGLVLGAVFALLGLSGSLLVYDHAILSIGEKPVPQVHGAGKALPFDAILAAARNVAADRRATATLQIPPTSQAVAVRFQKVGRGGSQQATAVFVDPATARVLELRTENPNPLFAFVHQFHGNLLLGRDGRQIIGWLGLGMLVLGLSGIVLWWPKRGAWKKAFGVRDAAHGYWFHRELHGAVGIWFWAVFVIVSFSGIAIVFPETVRSVVGLGSVPSGPMIDRRGGVDVAPVAGVKPVGVDGALALVKARFPTMEVRSIIIPARRSEALRVSLSSRPDGPVTVAFVDPFRKAIVAVRNPPGVPLENFVARQRPLHAGNGLGAIWRALVFLSGLLPTLFFTTGLVMWVKKRQARKGSSEPVLAGVSNGLG